MSDFRGYGKTFIRENLSVFALEVVDVAVDLPEFFVWEAGLFQEPMIVLRHDEVVFGVELLDQTLKHKKRVIRERVSAVNNTQAMIGSEFALFPINQIHKAVFTASGCGAAAYRSDGR